MAPPDGLWPPTGDVLLPHELPLDLEPSGSLETPVLGAPSDPGGGAGERRRELLTVQRRLWRRLQGELEEAIAADPPGLADYQASFEREVSGFSALSSPGELLAAAAEADVIYVGDYHSLAQAQEVFARLAAALSEGEPGGRELVLALEVVHERDQAALERFLLGELDPDAFRRAIDYERRWGFPWTPYAQILELARRRRLRVIGINCDPAVAPQHRLAARDRRAAEILARELLERPSARLLVLDGELHLARQHLPQRLVEVLAAQELPPRRQLRVHQNADAIYWKLAKRGLEEIGVVRLADDAFCVMNASPFEKLYSYLNWVSERATLAPARTSWVGEAFDEDSWDEDGSPADYGDQVADLVHAIARYLGIERDDLDDFELFTVNDLDFFDYLVEDESFTECEVEAVKQQILSSRSYFIPKGDLIYLADFSLANAAEEATHFLHHRCAGYRTDLPRSLATDFYFRSVTEALGYLGSKLIVPTRECWSDADCERLLEQERARQRLRRRRKAKQNGATDSSLAALARADEDSLTDDNLSRRLARRRDHALRACRVALRHKELERVYLESGVWSPSKRILSQETEVHLLVTRILGHQLGQRLFVALLAGVIDKDTVRDLLQAPLDERGLALETYLRLIELTQGLASGCAPRL